MYYSAPSVILISFSVRTPDVTTVLSSVPILSATRNSNQSCKPQSYQWLSLISRTFNWVLVTRQCLNTLHTPDRMLNVLSLSLCISLTHTHSFLNQHNPGCTLLTSDYVPVHNHRVSVLSLLRYSVISLM